MSRDLGLRIVEALLFAAEEPLPLSTIQAHLPGDLYAADLVRDLMREYESRGVRLERHGNVYAFRTAPDLAPYLAREQVQSRRLSKAALETLAIIAYHQPVTRAEIEEIRGVAVGKGTVDLLLETGWIQPRGRRETAGRPVTWVTTSAFLDQFDLATLDDLPRVEELLQSGLLALPGGADGAPVADEVTQVGGEETGPGVEEEPPPRDRIDGEGGEPEAPGHG